jgi:hypothetical protein
VSRIESTYLDLDFTRRSEDPAYNSPHGREGGQDRMWEHPSTAVADLVFKLHSNIDSIDQCIQSLSDAASHDAELERLSTERETKIAELQTAHENALKELASQRERERERESHKS